MSKPPTAPATSPSVSPNTRPRSAPPPKKLAASSSVSVHGSEVMIAHTPANSKVFISCISLPNRYMDYHLSYIQLNKPVGLLDTRLLLS